jgi:copper oxidase (laccase) domain-containing protein
MCCYEVGPDVASAFSGIFPELDGRREHPHLDLEEANRRVLADAGVPAERIRAARLCTRCRREDFHSYRRDGDLAGRMLSAIGVRDLKTPRARV